MNHDDLRKLSAATTARARALAESPRARPAQPAQPAAPAAKARPAPVAPIAHHRPALAVVGGKEARPKPRIPRGVVERAKARGRQADPERETRLMGMLKPAMVAPGVLPAGQKLAMDSALPSGVMNWGGSWMVNANWFEGQSFLGYPILAEMAQRAEYRKASERLSTECTRKWIKLVSTGDEDKTDRINQIDQFMQDLKVRDACEKAVFTDGTMGRAHLYLDTGDTDDRTELKTPIGDGRNKFSVNKIGKDKPLRRIKVVDPTWTYPAAYNAADPLATDWLDPETWYVMGKEVHRSRLLPLVGRPVPDLFKPAFSFGGLSLTQMMKTYVDNWTSVRQHVARVIANFSKNGIKTELMARLSPQAGGGGDPTADTDIFSRIDLYTAFSDNNGLLVLDKDSEEFFQFNTPLGTLDALMAQFLEQILLPSGMPLVVFLGLTPKGLNASSDGEIRAWESWVAAYQPHFFGDTIQRIIDFAQLSIYGDVDTTITYEWVPLRELDEKEEADLQKSLGDRDNGYIDRGVLDPLEVRQRLAKDPNSGYSNINPDDVPEPPDEGGEGMGGEGEPGGDPDGGPAGGGEDPRGAHEPDHDHPPGKPEGGDRAAGPFANDSGCVHLGEDVWAWDESHFEESKHPRVQGGPAAGQFAPAGGASGAGGVAPEKAPKSKKDLIASLLTKGVSAKEVLEATGWPSVSMPAQALAAGMKLEKYQDGGVTKYKGIPLTDAEKAELKAQLKAKKEAKAKVAQAQAQQAEAPKPMEKTFNIGAPEPIDPSKMTKVSGQKGSNPGGVYKDSSGNEFYVKNLKSEDHKNSEYTAAALYKLAGVNTLDYVPTVGNSVATKYVPLGKANVADLSPQEKALAQQDFAVHAWLANWDAVGTGGDNIGVIKGDHAPTVLDVGGSLGYRAQGEPKGEAFGTSVTELETMIDKSKSPDAAALYGSMTNGKKAESVSKVTMVRDTDIRTAVKANGMPDALAEKLIARKFNMAEEFGFKVIEEIEDPEFAAKHPRNPDGTFKSTGKVDEPAAKPAGGADPLASGMQKLASAKTMSSAAFNDLTPEEAKALIDKHGSPIKAYKAAHEKPAAAAPVPKPTAGELEKAKKTAAIKPQYVPGYENLATVAMKNEAQKAISDFNAKYEGKKLTDPDDLAKKVADFKSLGQKIADLKQEETASLAEIQAAEKKKAAEAAAKLKAQQEKAAKEHAAANAAVMKELGITEKEAEGFSGLAKMLGAKSGDLVQAFKQYEDQAKGYGYPITGFQAALIRNYSDGGYVGINQALRFGAWTPAQHVYVKMVNQAIRKMPPHKGVCYRGTNLPASELAKYQEGHIVEERAFMSTSAKSGGAFGGNVRFTVTATGKRGTHIKKLSNHASEDEVLFAARTFFRVTKVEKAGNVTHVHMEEWDDE